MKQAKQFSIAAGLFGVLAIIGLLAFLHRYPATREITSSELGKLITESKIASATAIPTVYHGIYTVTGTLKQNEKTQSFRLTTHLDDAQLKTLATTAGIKIQVPGQNMRGQWVNVLTVLFIGGLVGWAIYRQTNVGNSKDVHQVRNRPNVRFDDVAGIEEAKVEVQEIVDFLKHPKKYKRLGGKLPKGILLIGPPGTGKTMLAKAIAGEADANFFSVHGSDFNEVFVGVGAKRVRQLFRQAIKAKPAIIFIDEIDCLGKNRKLDTHSETQQTNNALLAAMDGFESSDGVVVLAATNRPEDLDEALMRPGRFDRKVHVPYPDMKGRRAILNIHALDKPIRDRDEVLATIAQTTPGMSGADLANLVNEAAILCAQQDAEEITLTELEAARDKVRFGKERKSMVLKPAERELVAFHEAGHALINLKMNQLPQLYKVSIVPRGQALGTTTMLPNEDQNIHNREFLWEELVVLMGGRAAEKIFYGTTSNGASGDLDMARKIARKMVLEWGMGQKLYYEPNRNDAEQEINRLLESADREAFAIVENQKRKARLLAEALLERETLTREEVQQLFRANCPADETASAQAAFPV